MTKLTEIAQSINENSKLLEAFSNRNGFNLANIGGDEAEQGGIYFFQQKVKDEIIKDVLKFQIVNIKDEAAEYGINDIPENTTEQLENIDNLNLLDLKNLLQDIKSLETKKNDVLAKKIAEEQADRMKAEQLARLEIEARQKREAAERAAKDADEAENLRATEATRLSARTNKVADVSNKTKSAEQPVKAITDNKSTSQ